jgi:hypothetical protein
MTESSVSAALGAPAGGPVASGPPALSRYGDDVPAAAQTDRPVVVVSNRGPLSVTIVDGELDTKRGGGGLVTALGPAV